ncbi:MAG: hypothetical protein AAF927_21815 [Bacteroidota bacterium]
MKTNENSLIIYDDSCPMCKAYTKSFVEMGLLRPENRLGFAETDVNLRQQIDLDRGRHEIPLLDRESGEVRYGLRALTHLLSQKWPFLRPVLKSNLVYYTFYPLYQIITYNRRLIANSQAPAVGFDCAPDFHAFYRFIYIFLGLLVSLVIGLKLPLTLLALWGGLLSIGATYYTLTRQGLARWDAFGHLATVAMITALLSLPLVFVGGDLPLWGTLSWAGLALGYGLKSWYNRMA